MVVATADVTLNRMADSLSGITHSGPATRMGPLTVKLHSLSVLQSSDNLPINSLLMK